MVFLEDDEMENVETKPPRILIVDDEELIRDLIATSLSKFGFSYKTAVNGKDALEKMKQEKIDAVITDIKMPEMDGILLTSEISNAYPGVPVMVMTAFDEEFSAATALSAGARDFITKPFSIPEFILRLRKMIMESYDEKPRNKVPEKEEEINHLLKELENTLKKE